MGNHAADGFVEDAGRSTEVERTWRLNVNPHLSFENSGPTATGGVVTGHLAEIGEIFYCNQTMSAMDPGDTVSHSVLGSQMISLGNIPAFWVLGHTFCAKEFPRDVERFAADHHDLLTIQQLFGDNAGQATKKVTFAVNDDLKSDTTH